MEQGYYWVTKKSGIVSEIVWITGKALPTVYRIGYNKPFELSEFEKFEFINNGYRSDVTGRPSKPPPEQLKLV